MKFLYMHIFNQDLSGNSGRMMILVAKGKPRLQIGDTQLNATTALTPGEWTHLAFRRSGSGDMLIYTNGCPAASGQNSKAALAATDFVIGTLLRDNKRAFGGELSEVRVRTSDRSNNTLLANWSRRMKGSETGLFCCWPMDDGTGTTCR